MLRALLFAAALFLLTPAEAASFNCAKASTPDEHAVCDDPRLSELDSVLARAHAEAQKEFGEDEIRSQARNFMKDRRACASDASCILAAYVGVLRQLSSYGSKNYLPDDLSADMIADGRAKPSDSMPDAVGGCVMTRVDGVHPRLGDGGAFTDEDFDSGTGVDFTNGGYQVSYDREEALIGSKKGDRVVMCLVSVPHDCPAGDDRGRMYTVTNERTGATWTLPDSQHMCGGA